MPALTDPTMPHTTPELFPRERHGALPAPSSRDWGRMAWRQRWLIGASTLLVGALALVFISAQTQVYATTAKVWVQTDQQGSPFFIPQETGG